ncbi:MAG: tetratricopeptide repeat protein [Syntrophales bacterium]|nr:tetratricopeptide repeat protein [Syntrophales bacterium]
MRRIKLFLMTLVLLTLSCATETTLKQSDVHMNLGAAYIESGDYTNALKELIKAEQLNSSDPRIHYLKAMAYAGKGYHELAIEECRKAVALKPDYSEVYNYMGTLHLVRGQIPEALENFEKALSNVLYATPSVALFNMGKAYTMLKDYDRAMAKLQEAALKDNRNELNPFIELEMGRISGERGDWSRAVQHLKRAIEYLPSLTEAYYLLGNAQLKLGNSREARENLETVVKISPESELGKKAQRQLLLMK